MKRVHVGLIAVVAMFVAAGVIFSITIVFLARKGTSAKKGPRVYNRQEFVVIHRPHLRYYVDVAHNICFASRSPHNKGLSYFYCPDSLVELARTGVSPFRKPNKGNKKGDN